MRATGGNLGTHLCGHCAADTGADEAHSEECFRSRKATVKSMTVAELVYHLESMPQDATVMVHTEDGEVGEALAPWAVPVFGDTHVIIDGTTEITS